MAVPSPYGNNAVPTKNESNNRTHRNMVEAELIASVSWLINLRWLAGAGVIAASWVVRYIFKLSAPTGVLCVLGAGILIYNLIFFVLERRYRYSATPAPVYSRLAKWQTGLDWLAMTLLIHFSGGIESPAILFFIFHIIIASIFFPRGTAYGSSLLAITLVTGIALLEYFGILPHHAVVGYLTTPLYLNKLYVLAVLVFFASTGLISAYLVTSIHDRLRQREEEIMELTDNLQRATARLQALNEGARAVGSTLDLPQVLDRLVKSSARAMDVHACSIRLLDKTGRQLEPVAVYGLSQAYLDKGPVDAHTNPLARETLSGRVINIPDAPENPLLQYPDEARQEGIQSILSAPLIGKSGPLGILRAYAVETHRFTPDDEAFLGAIAAQGSIAIENALAYQSIEELDALKSQFVRMVTHELRSPVSVTRSLLRTIVTGYAGKVSPQQLDILNRASRRIEFLQKLIDDLLDMAAGKVVEKSNEVLSPVELGPAIQKVVDRYEVPAREKELSIWFENRSPGKPMTVMATLEGLDRIFNNLVSNAVKYTPRGGHVRLELSQADHEAQVIVEDNGIGIPENAMEHLFEEFYRAPNAKEMEQEGTGLGLTIVKDMVARYGGHISVQSQLNQGTRFIVILPVEGE
jgi:signal transduction histidine kinase